MNNDAAAIREAGEASLAVLRAAHAQTSPQARLSTLPSAVPRFAFRRRRQEAQIADVCLIVGGAYPYVSGGVSAWVHGVISRQSDLRFCVVAILPEPPPPKPKYGAPPNLQALHHLYLSEACARGGGLRPSSFNHAELASVDRLMAPLVKARRATDLLDSTLAWNLVCDLYSREMPHESFLHFFWAWRALFGGLVATLAFPLPPARVYHTVSTGYAGLLAARAAVA